MEFRKLRCGFKNYCTIMSTFSQGVQGVNTVTSVLQWNAGNSNILVSNPQRESKNKQRFWRWIWFWGFTMENNPPCEPEKYIICSYMAKKTSQSLSLWEPDSTSSGFASQQFFQQLSDTCTREVQFICSISYESSSLKLLPPGSSVQTQP